MSSTTRRPGARRRRIARHATRLVLFALLLVAAAVAIPTAAAAPLTIDPSRTLVEQWDYAPEYIRNIPAFDPLNRPYIRSRWASQDDTSYVHTLEQGAWVKHEFVSALVAAYPGFAGTVNAGGWGTERLAFDELGRAYTVLTIRLEEGEMRNVLLYSLDGCRTWGVARLPFGESVPRYDYRWWGNVHMEYPAGANRLQGPPFLMFWKQVAPWKGVWASRNELYVLQPRFEGGELVVPAPKLVCTRALDPVFCAGGSSLAATAGDTTYFAYARVAPLGSGTTPCWVGTYDRRTGTADAGVQVGGSKPANDSHCTPGLCLDSRGYLHVVMGGHGTAFQYTRSVRPYDAREWTRKTPVCVSGYREAGTDADGRGRQTYVSLVCAPDDTLHLLFRQVRRRVDAYLDGGRYDALAYQRKPRGQKWSRPVVLVRGPSIYAQYYHKLAIDRLGRLFVSGSYWTDHDLESTRLYRRFHHRFVLYSGSAGESWRLATTAHFAAGFGEPAPAVEPSAPPAEAPASPSPAP